MTSPEKEIQEYGAPQIRDLGTLSEQTLTTINKTGTSGDVIVLDGENIPVPGSSIIP
jgi:hypothetical protein